jgi:hypothetical protein
MANQQPATNKRKAGGQGNRRPGAGSTARPSGATVERDDTYGLISVIYHSLQGAETCGQYLEDARRSKSAELVAFFEECREEQNERAIKGRRLLAAQLEGLDDEDEEDDDDE